jgi:hypothetical protein
VATAFKEFDPDLRGTVTTNWPFTVYPLTPFTVTPVFTGPTKVPITSISLAPVVKGEVGDVIVRPKAPVPVMS